MAPQIDERGWPSFAVPSLVGAGERCAVIGYENGEQASGLGLARILAHEMIAAGRSKKLSPAL